MEHKSEGPDLGMLQRRHRRGRRPRVEFPQTQQPLLLRLNPSSGCHEVCSARSPGCWKDDRGWTGSKESLRLRVRVSHCVTQAGVVRACCGGWIDVLGWHWVLVSTRNVQAARLALHGDTWVPAMSADASASASLTLEGCNQGCRRHTSDPPQPPAAAYCSSCCATLLKFAPAGRRTVSVRILCEDFLTTVGF